MMGKIRHLAVTLLVAVSAISIFSKGSVYAGDASVAEKEQAIVKKPLVDILDEKIISLNFERAHIRDILDYIAKEAGVNICFCEGKSKEESDYLLTTRVRNISAFEALDIITRLKELTYYIEENIIWVGEIDKLKGLMKQKPLENILKEKTIGLKFDKTDIRDVLRYIADITGVNIYFCKRNAGKKSRYRVSVYLRDISAFGALDIITRATGLSYYIDDHVVLVGENDELEGLIPLVTRVHTARRGDVENLTKMIESLLSEKGKIIFDKQRNILIITDRKDIMETVDKILEAID